MGIPKFFRWISERYPLTSQLITPNSIPTFDNLYLDMNGIIHNCSHPPSSENDPHFRITEEQMILAIFAYIDHLFTKIKPQKVFFMAIDGVAPRAKMNQQRSRRFRTARDAVEQRKEAERKGESLPEEKAFDSNCITPGTPFMARLSAHLKYYVTKRITEDAEWRNVKVILSGHDVPGEGEHKIQEFIRLTKAQPDYNPNTRHCLYGLDADLIMLGLLSHDPHFCLLREEVTFGRKQKKSTGLSGTNFFLLHLSLLREYLDLEFSSLATQIDFEYDFERIIDDFILMGIFVGNDFLPHLPDLHINEGALERIWAIYKEILPQAGGYLNEHGTISLPRLQLMLDRLAKFEVENFEEEFAEENWYKGKQQKTIDAMEKARKKGALVITKDQKKIYNSLKQFVTKHQKKPTATDRWTWPNDLVARDRRFIQELADDLHLHLTWDETDDYGQNLIVARFNMEGLSESEDEDEDVVTEETDGEWSDEQEEEEEEEDEGDVAIQRVLTKYDKAKVVDNVDENWEESYEEKLKQKLEEWKKDYYKTKLECDTKEEARQVSYKYIEGLQWILNYYYKGVSSWGWFYPYHYAPRITDLVKIDDFEFNFEYGKPFTPYQQLMGVLPAESQEHVPAVYRDLMTEETSPIIDFYPVKFELDMNGKKQDWEAVVKIPFIDQDRLLKAMAPRDARLSGEEKARNNGNVLSTQFNYDDEITGNYPSSHPGFFPDIVGSRCRSEPFDLPVLGNGVDLIHGLLKGVHLGSGALAGFPSLHTLPHQGALGYHGVSVFQSDSRNQSMIITLTNTTDRPKTAEIAKNMIGQKTYHAWPYLHEGMVVAVSDDMFKYELQQVGKTAKVVSNPHNPFQAVSWRKQADHAEHHQSKRFGVITGHVEVVLHVRPLKGLKRLDTGALVKDYQSAEKELIQPYQLAVTEVAFEDERYLERPAPPISEEFPVGERVLFLGQLAYGAAAQVTSTGQNSMDINIAYFPNEQKENIEFSRIVAQRPAGKYYPSPTLCRRIGISALSLSRITSTLLVQLKDGLKINVGLALKFESKGLKVLGYSRRNDRGWEFSEVTAQTLERYKKAFPEPFHYFDSRGGDIVTASELCPTAENPDAVIKEMKKWLKAEGLIDLEPVSLFAEQLEKESVKKIEELADLFKATKTPETIKRATVRGIPRQAVLKPAHSTYRLQGQGFVIGDRVIMVQDSAVGGVPLAMKGVVIGIGNKDIDVVWDVPFMGGETLQGRCSEYRGSTIGFDACLNLTRPQFLIGAQTPPAPIGVRAPFKPQLGPQPAVQMNNYRPANPSHRPVQVLANPAHARHGAHAPHTNGVGYGNAAKGIRPPPSAPYVQPGGNRHHDHLASVLTGQQRILHAQQQALSQPQPGRILATHQPAVSPSQEGRIPYVMPPRGAHLPPRPLNGGPAAKPVVVKSPPKGPAAGLPNLNGEASKAPAQTQGGGPKVYRGGKFAQRGGGGGRGRGGRGRGGGAGAAAPAA